MFGEFNYRVNAKAGGHFPGHHRSVQPGGAFEFRGHVPLLARPDPRRLDINVSLRDPFGGWVVRDFQQRSSVPVYVIGDISASMGFASAGGRKLDVLADILSSTAYSAHRTGDRFGFVACDTQVREDFFQPPSHSRGAGAAVEKSLRSLNPQGKNANGLLDAHKYLARQRALIFLVSDFHFPIPLLDDIMQSLSQHQVIPIVLWDEAEYKNLPNYGFATLRDSESGKQRSVWMRPKLRERIQTHFTQHRAAMEQIFLQRQSPALFLHGDFAPDMLTQYFFSHA
ncbi:MAG: hypothetical protein RL020_825 [Pseudomonadota bacterium]|jgi:uncharacterized protein (DUF58 family)